MREARRGRLRSPFVNKLTREKWEKADAVHKYGTTFDEATRQQRKSATYHYLELHMVEVFQSE